MWWWCMKFEERGHSHNPKARSALMQFIPLAKSTIYMQNQEDDSRCDMSKKDHVNCRERERDHVYFEFD